MQIPDFRKILLHLIQPSSLLYSPVPHDELGIAVEHLLGGVWVRHPHDMLQPTYPANFCHHQTCAFNITKCEQLLMYGILEKVSPCMFHVFYCEFGQKVIVYCVRTMICNARELLNWCSNRKTCHRTELSVNNYQNPIWRNVTDNWVMKTTTKLLIIPLS